MTIGGTPNLESWSEGGTLTIEKQGSGYCTVADIKATYDLKTIETILCNRGLASASVEKGPDNEFYIRITTPTLEEAVDHLIHLGSIVTNARIKPESYVNGQSIADLVINVARQAHPADTVISEARVVLRNSGFRTNDTTRA